ncbi:MAG TPA: methyltransferase domain-containing protein [Candidatus Acetothermia bacterium]|nr:methyltransferase domain-containing protein [Candidatus Acetothermia bacterium]
MNEIPVRAEVLLRDLLRSPRDGTRLRVQGDRLISERGAEYPVVDGIPWLLDESHVADVDRALQKQYTESDAAKYDRQLQLASLLLGCWEPRERRRMVALLDLKPGDRVLEISVGTGANLPYLSRSIGSSGHVVALDLSWDMMQVARARADRLPTQIDFVRADAVRLPFADGVFDAVFHFGGFNLFGDRWKALQEAVRVTRPGGTIVLGDEGLSESRRRSWLGRKLLSMNSLFLFRPPLDKLPWTAIEGLEMHWAWRETFYVLKFRTQGRRAVTSEEDVLRQRIAEREAQAGTNRAPTPGG